MVIREFKISFDMQATLEQDMAKLHQFAPPAGRLFLAEYETKIVGCVGLKKIGQDVGEIKRMYMRYEYCRQEIGRSLLTAIMAAASQICYQKIRLYSTPFTKEAQALYRSLGFQEIEPYAESEIPQEYRKYCVFMEIVLK